MTKKKQTSISFEPKIEDIIQTLRIDQKNNVVLSNAQVIRSLVITGLKAKGLL